MTEKSQVENKIIKVVSEARRCGYSPYELKYNGGYDILKIEKETDI